MTFRYSTIWIYIDLTVALAMSLSLYIGLKPEWWGWLLFSPLFLYMVFESVRKYGYSFTVDSDHISVGSFKRAQYPVSDITAVDDLVGLLRKQAKLPG